MRCLNIIFWSGVALAAGVQIRGIDGHLLDPFRAAGRANVLFFVASDCPISNSYAPEIQRLCREYGLKGVGCSLLYEDVELNAPSVREHLEEYGYRGIPAAIDSDRKIAGRAGATVTPEAVVVNDRGEVRYRGRIDNFYAALGKPRQQVTVHDLADALDAVLAGRAVPNPETHALGCYIVPPDILRK
jgi:thiol-disulfide isomerase/thioredoxin